MKPNWLSNEERLNPYPKMYFQPKWCLLNWKFPHFDWNFRNIFMYFHEIFVHNWLLRKNALQENGYILSIHMYISKMIFYVIDYINCGTVSIW